MLIRVRVVPNARRSEVLGWEDDPRAGRVLRVKVAAPPVEGRANEALCAFLSEELGLAKSKVALEKGGTSRHKTLSLPDDCVLPPWPSWNRAT